MRYIKRDETGKIVGEFARPQEGVPVEELPDDHPDLVEFRNPPPPKPGDRVAARFASDPAFAALVRVLAAETGKTEADVIAAIKAAADR